MFNGDLKDFASCLGRRRNCMLMSVFVVSCGELPSDGIVEDVVCDGPAS